MTWGLRSAGATGMARLALALVAVGSIVGMAVPGLAIELGEPQALPSAGPLYTFRLPLIAPLYGPSAPARVAVRQPPDTLAFVKQHVIEFRLRALADVELEVSYGGQTLNRLLPKSELQAARARVDTALASSAPLPARAKERDRPSAEAMPVAPVSPRATDHSLIEREIAGLRQGIHALVERVAPWEGLSAPVGNGADRGVPDVLVLTVGGFFAVGGTALTLGCLMRRRRRARERQRRQAPTLSIRRARDQAALTVPIPAVRQRVPLAGPTPQALAPVRRVRRIRVARKTRRRFRLWAPGHAPGIAQEHGTAPIRPGGRSSQRLPAAPAELIEALVQLRSELMRLQGGLPTHVTPAHPEAGSRRHLR
jgi:hypothetical protein